MDATTCDFISDLPADTRDLDDLMDNGVPGQVVEAIQERTPQNDTAAPVSPDQDCVLNEAAKVPGLYE